MDFSGSFKSRDSIYTHMETMIKNADKSIIINEQEKIQNLAISGTTISEQTKTEEHPYSKANEAERLEAEKGEFDDEFNQGFDYAYTYPGMNKVIQAVGRLIRTNNDIGVAALFDDRYTHTKYLDLFPKNWSHYQTVSKGQYLQTYILKFWDKHKEK